MTVTTSRLPPYIAVPMAAVGRFFAWVRLTLDMLCDRPDHLQRLAIIGSGISLYPAVGLLIWIVWKGYAQTEALQHQSMGIMGIALYIFLALFGLVIVSLLGTIKGLRVSGPGGSSFEIETTAGGSSGPSLGQQTTVVVPGRRGGAPVVVQTQNPVTPPPHDAGSGAGKISE